MTGATGFLGAHSVAAIVRAGHTVRLLVRDESAVDRALTPLGIDASAVEVITGDVTGERGVAALVRGADAVLHAAAVYSFDSRRRRIMRRTNEVGTEVVLGAARRAGVGRIVHVSTVAAMLPAAAGVLRADSPVGTAREPYLASKAAAEEIARRHQGEGAPVVITYPSALIGPHDPCLGDQNARLRNALRGLMPIWPSGGFPVGDVRDTARLHARLIDADILSGNRFFGPGTYLSTRDYVRTLREVTGRALPAIFLPARTMTPVGRLTSALQRVWPWHIPAEYGAIYLCGCATRVAPEAPAGGVTARPVADSMRDTVRWLHERGLLADRQSGRIAKAVA
ncbi:NAD-dependent epimerase/dehydratase [Amycolatopsis decaplanina DSM 44594]|uniref:NAD-dependent epimerase/dehydratase n=1 Tax=Amycolatopsis decaplanina DSM 44594 TaxID=1284240 RepID=M2ZE52_9PSEU|nr:NAD-dependent epimerase/dehydratase [Amycolatopsis decaplanina DSM 44594]